MKISPMITTQASAATEVAMDGAKKAKLAQAAQQFEAMLLQEMLKPMRSGQDSWGGDDAGSSGSDSSDSSMDTISSFGTEALATAIAKGGGFGIAKQAIRQVTLEHQQAAEKAASRY